MRWIAHASVALMVALGGMALASCKEDDPAPAPQKRPGLPAGTLLVTLRAAATGVELEQPAQVKTGSQKVDWSSAEDAKLTNLDPAATHTISVEGPYLADSLEVKFEDPKVGQRVVLAVLPTYVERSGRSELPTPPKHLEIHLANDGVSRAKWVQGTVTVSTFGLPATGPDAATIRGQWEAHGAHKQPTDPQKDVLRLMVPEEVSVARAADYYAQLQLPEREMRSASGLRKVPAFEVVFSRPPQPLPARVPIEETLRALTAIKFEDATSGGFDRLAIEVLRSCETALCEPASVTGGWERLAVSYATAKRTEEAEDAFFVARMSRLGPGPDAGQQQDDVELVEPGTWLDELDLPEAARAPYAMALGRKLPRVRHGAVSVSGRIAAPDIVRAVFTRAGPIAACYAVGLTKNDKLQGRLAARFIIDNEGQVSNVANGGTDLPGDDLRECVLREFLRLPPLVPEAGIVTVTFPFMFAPAAS